MPLAAVWHACPVAGPRASVYSIIPPLLRKRPYARYRRVVGSRNPVSHEWAMNDDATKNGCAGSSASTVRGPSGRCCGLNGRQEIAGALKAGIRDCSLKVDIGRLSASGNAWKGGTLLSSAKSSKPAIAGRCPRPARRVRPARRPRRSKRAPVSQSLVGPLLTRSRKHLCPWSEYRTVRTLRPPYQA